MKSFENYLREQMYDIDYKKAERIIARAVRKAEEIKQEERERILKEVKKIEIASKFMNTIDRDKVLNILKELK